MKITWGNKISKTMLLEGTTKGKNNPAYTDGRTLKKYYCKTCNKRISWQSAVYGQNLCCSCSQKLLQHGKNNSNYQDGRTLKNYYCPDCGKKLSSYQVKRCKKCVYIWKKKVGILKGKNNPMWGKHHSEKTIQKNKEEHLGKYHSEETKKKISKFQKGRKKPPFSGKLRSNSYLQGKNLLCWRGTRFWRRRKRPH